MTYDPKTLSIGNALESFYEIPQYQRPFNWTPAQVEDLLTDVFADPAATQLDGYFLGSIVTIRKDHSTSTIDEPFVLIDGQQRITTLSLILLVLLPLVDAETTGDAESRQERSVKTRSRLRVRKRETPAGDHVNTPRLTLQDQNGDADVYERLIQEAGSIDSPDIKSHSLVVAAKAIRTKIEALCTSGPYAGDLTAASNMLDLLCERVSLVRINADTDSAAFRLFEAMNDRGLDLSAADLIKNKLLSRCRPKDTEHVLRDWAQAIERVGTGGFIAFLRTYWIAKHGFIRKDKLYDSYKTFLGKEAPAEIRTFTRELNRAADIYRMFDNPPENPKKDKGLVAVLRRMRLYNAKSFRPALLAARLFRESDYELQLRVARLCEAITVRWSVISKFNANALEELYSNMAKVIRETKGAIPMLIPTETLATIPDGERFRVNFISADTSVTRQWFAILEALNHHLAGEDAELNLWSTTGIHVEHILPQQPEEGALLAYGCTSQEDVDKWAPHVGNLTLLGGRKNRKISNGAFVDKVENAYKGSDVFITREIGEQHVQWTPKEIAARAEALARVAATVFSLKHNDATS